MDGRVAAGSSTFAWSQGLELGFFVKAFETIGIVRLLVV
jgi:hypothetical protein